MLLLRFIAFGLLIFILYKIFKPKPTPVVEQSEEVQERNEAEIRKKQSRSKFIGTFGFGPELITEYRYRKEMILKLGLLMEEVKGSAERALRSPSVYRDSYLKVSKEYAGHLELIAIYDPEFERDIPHWTELPEFARRWIDGERFEKNRKK